jgi:uroporphyrinogen decarboxylase
MASPGETGSAIALLHSGNRLIMYNAVNGKARVQINIPWRWISMQLRQDRMSSGERIAALFSHEKPDRIPIMAWGSPFGTYNAGYSVTEAFDNPEKAFNATLWTWELYGWEPVGLIFGPTVLGAMDFGGEVRSPQGEYEGSEIIKSNPVQTEEDLLNLEMPDPKTAGRIPLWLEFAKLQEARGLPVTFCTRSPFTMAGNICGLERLCRWLMKRPELAERAMRMAIDHIFNVMGYWVETFGPEKVFVFMASASEANQVISPKHFEKFALPFHVQFQQRMKALGIQRFLWHICGDQNLNLPHIANLSSWKHPSILTFGHEVDLETAASLFPKDIILGNIDPSVIQFGTPQQIYQLCEIAIEKGRKAPGGYIMGPGCTLPAYAPPVNAYALRKAVNDFGWYE